MSQEAELHLLKQRIAELEETVETIDRGIGKKEIALRDKFAQAICPVVMLEWEEKRDFDLWARVWLMADQAMEARTK